MNVLNRACILIASLGCLFPPEASATDRFDVVIYGGTSAGIVAGLQAASMGKTVVVIEPSEHLGGLTTGGLGQTDIGNKQVIGGLSREFYRRIARHYQKPGSWKWQERGEYRDGGQTRTGENEDSMWTFEPSAAQSVFFDWIAESKCQFYIGDRLNRQSGVHTQGNRIVAIQMESLRVFEGDVFIDATYEGDLMAAAGVSYTVGRESKQQYGESLGGVQTRMARHHNFVDGVDPYVVPGDASSGLLPFLDPDGPGQEGEADHRVQAYCFRMCLTDHPENRIPFQKPERYNERWYELLLRNYEAGEKGLPWINSSMPNRKTDTNNRLGFSTDFIGQNYDYADASYARRKEIIADHLRYQQGLMWTLANHPRVPEPIRKEVSRWGMCKDEFQGGGGWQSQLYVREARRMLSDFVMTQSHCRQTQIVDDSIGMGAYTMDSHNVQRYVTKDGMAKNEGDVQVGGFPPYPISYRSITPKRDECANLLVPVCLSASHIAFGSIRMEPVFMVLGQSAATAACMAIDSKVAVQDVDYPKLRERLLRDEQVLEYDAPITTSEFVPMSDLDGIVVDDTQATLVGGWIPGAFGKGVHQGYLHDNALSDGSATATFKADLPMAGIYEVQVSYVPHENRAQNARVEVTHSEGSTTMELDQRKPPSIEKLFVSIGKFQFSESATVQISNQNARGYLIVDAVRWIPANEE